MCYRSKETDLSCMVLFVTDFIDLNGFEAGLLEKRLDLSSDKVMKPFAHSHQHIRRGVSLLYRCSGCTSLEIFELRSH